MDCLCIWLITIFDSQKFLILMKLSLPILCFVACAFQYQIQEITAKCNVPTFSPIFSSTVAEKIIRTMTEDEVVATTNKLFNAAKFSAAVIEPAGRKKTELDVDFF